MSRGSDREAMAAELALGVLDMDERLAATRLRHRDGGFAETVEEYELMLAPLAFALQPLAPPADMLDRIEAEIDRRARPLPGGITLRAHEGEWAEFAPGVQARQLWRHEHTGRQGILLSVDPGAEYPEHDHDSDEEFYMISGDIRFGDVVLHAGDYHIARRGSHHGPGVSREGCLCIMMTGL